MSDKALATTHINNFRKAFEGGLSKIVEAAGIYVKALDDDPKIGDRFREEFAETIPYTMWSSFEAIGRKWMHPKLLMGAGCRNAGKLKRLPYSIQERIFEGELFEMLLESGDTLMVDLRKVDGQESDQMFDGANLRDLSAQKLVIEARKAARVAAETRDNAVLMPYTINGGCVTFRRNTRLTRAELRRLLTEV